MWLNYQYGHGSVRGKPMKHETLKRTATEHGLSSHLELALESSETETKNYHIRQALQLQIADADTE